MSSEHSQHQNDIDCNDDEKNLSREELLIRLEFEKLERAKLRRRLTQLEKIAGVKPDVDSERTEKRKEDLAESLDELEAER